MHVQMVTYRLSDDAVSDNDFVAANEEFAQMMTAVPGLLAKIWLKNAGENVYGGIYLWRDREAYDSFVASELWASVLGDDSVSDLESRDFAVMEELTRSTQPLLQMV